MAKQDDYIRITARIPPDVHEALVELSKMTERSLNGELVARLQEAIARAKAEIRPIPLAIQQPVSSYQASEMTNELIEVIKALPIEKQIALLELLR